MVIKVDDLLFQKLHSSNCQVVCEEKNANSSMGKFGPKNPRKKDQGKFYEEKYFDKFLNHF